MAEQAVQFLCVLLHSGRLPAVLHLLAPSGVIAVSLLPAIAPLSRQGVSDAEANAALALVSSQRETFLTAWTEASAPALSTPPEARIANAAYDPKGRRLLLTLVGSAAMILPVKLDPRLDQAEDARLGRVVVLGDGQGLVWPMLGYALGLPALLALVLTARAPEEAARVWEGLVDGANTRVRPVLAPSAKAPAPSAAVMESDKIKSLLGLILQREGYVEQTQLEHIFQEQRRMEAAGQPVSFGQAAVALGHITQSQLEFALYLQNELGHNAEKGKPLGVALLEAAALAPSVLLSALEEQKRTSQRLGEILVRRGAVSEDLLKTFLGQREPAPVQASEPEKEPAAAENESKSAKSGADAASATNSTKVSLNGSSIRSLLGIILERENYLNQHQVREILAEQERLKREGKSRSFGEVALDLKFILPEQLKFAVQLQTKLAYTPGKPKPLGFFLLENGVIRPSQLQRSLDEAARQNLRLGEMLVQQGIISDQMLEVFLRMQRESANMPASV